MGEGDSGGCGQPCAPPAPRPGLHSAAWAAAGLSARPASGKRTSGLRRVTVPARSKAQHLGAFFPQAAWQQEPPPPASQTLVTDGLTSHPRLPWAAPSPRPLSRCGAGGRGGCWCCGGVSGGSPYTEGAVAGRNLARSPAPRLPRRAGLGASLGSPEGGRRTGRWPPAGPLPSPGVWALGASELQHRGVQPPWHTRGPQGGRRVCPDAGDPPPWGH